MTTLPPVYSPVTEAQIAAFLVAARETIAAVPICWLATRSLEGGANARAVSAFAGAPGSDEWTRRFLVRQNSRKVGEMRAAPGLRSHISIPPATARSRSGRPRHDASTTSWKCARYGRARWTRIFRPASRTPI